VNPSAGGARAAGGLTFQAQVFAWWAALAVSGAAPGLGLDPPVRIEAVGCETGFSVDDVGVALSGGGFILVQAKGGMRRLDPQAQDLRSAVDQLVSAMIRGLRADVALRPVDVSRDRLVLATNQDSSLSFRALGTVCARLRDLPLSVPLDTAAVNENERRALTALLRVIRSAWTAAARHEPAEGDLRRLLRILEVSRLDFETGTGADLVRSEAMLQQASVPQPFSVLVGMGIEAARSQAWRQRHTLMTAVGLGHPAVQPLLRQPPLPGAESFAPSLPLGIPVAAPVSTCTWIVKASPQLWLRSGPGFKYPTVDRLYYGQRAHGNCDGVESGGTTWYLLRRNDDGWAWGNSEYLQPIPEP
jgi:hypothetical protein